MRSGRFPPRQGMADMPMAGRLAAQKVTFGETMGGGWAMRWIVRIGVTLFLFTVAAVVALFLMPTDRIAKLAADRFERATGRTLAISGDITPSFWPTLGVTTGPVSLANAPWSEEGPMLQASGMSVGVDTQALWGGALRITGVSMTSPLILLERRADGVGNWEFGDGVPPAEAGAAGGPTGFAVDLATIRDGAITFLDHQTDSRQSLSSVDADLSLPRFDGPGQATVSGIMNGQAIELTLQVDNFGAAVSGEVAPVSVVASVGPARVNFDGRMGLSPFVAEGAVDAQLGDLAALFDVLGMEKPDLPAGFGATEVGIAGNATLTAEGTAHLRDGVVTLDTNRLTGDFDIDPRGDRPMVTASLRATAIDLSALAGGGAPAGAGAGGGWSDDRIDASGLAALDANVALTADSVDLGAVTLGPTRAGVTIERARAVVDLRQVTAYEGNVTGQFVVNARDGLSMAGDLALDGVALQPLLAAVAGTDRLAGTADGRITFLTSGNSMAAMMQTLSGDGTVALGRGELRGLDLAGMLRTLDPGYVGEGAKTIFDRMTASFAIKDGVLRNNDLSLNAPIVNVTGKGRVNLGKRTLDYRVVPTALASAEGAGGFSAPLDITGPWSDLRYKLDIEAITGVDVDGELKARLAAEAKDKLGIVAREGESLEDAARRRAQRKLEREAKRALEGLLGGN